MREQAMHVLPFNKSLERTVENWRHTVRAAALLRGPMCNEQRWLAVQRNR
jgi:hypothetical protein